MCTDIDMTWNVRNWSKQKIGKARNTLKHAMQPTKEPLLPYIRTWRSPLDDVCSSFDLKQDFNEHAVIHSSKIHDRMEWRRSSQSGYFDSTWPAKCSLVLTISANSPQNVDLLCWFLSLWENDKTFSFEHLQLLLSRKIFNGSATVNVNLNE